MTNVIHCKLSKIFRSSMMAGGLIAGQAVFAQLLPVNVQPGDKVSTVNIVLTRHGPLFRQVTIPANATTLLIQNYSGMPMDTFSLRQQGAIAEGSAPPVMPSLLDLHSTIEQHRDYKVIQLKPGSYVVTFLGHPNWKVDLTVTEAVQQ